MARSPLTLAASVASALPRVGVVGVGMLTEDAAGRYDSALAQLDDGRRVVVRAPVDTDGVAELAAEVRALRALTPGVRGLLPFHAPHVLGEAGLRDARAVVVDFLPGYRVDAAHLPPGRGAATSVGEALAAMHGLPISIVRVEGLPARSPAQIRDDAARLVDRAEATRRVPASLLNRWRRALETDELWRFESAVVLGGASATSFLFEDLAEVPTVTGVLEWHGLSVGDPAVDLQWLSSAPAAADDVYDSYSRLSRRAPDPLLRERARLYAELEFAKWLVHGHELDRDEIIDDAVTLLTALSEGVLDDDLVTDAALDVDDAIALLDRVPESAPAAGDTSMQTDAYDPEELSLWIAAEGDTGALDDLEAPTAETGAPADETTDDDALVPKNELEDESTESETAPIDVAPIDMAAWAATSGWGDGPAPRRGGEPDASASASLTADDDDVEGDNERSAESALRRWTAEQS